MPKPSGATITQNRTAVRITEKALTTLIKNPPAKGYRILWDSEPGFGVRITAAGCVSFILIYRFHSRQRRYTLGQYPSMRLEDARVEAVNLKADIRDEKRDPMEDRQRERLSEPTMADLAGDYLKRYAEVKKRPTSLRNDRQMIDRIIKPHFHKGKMRLKAIGRSDVEHLHTSLKDTPYQANRVLSLLSKMFGIAVEREWMEKNVAHGVERFHEDKRSRWLTIEELQRFREALDAYEDQNAANALRLLMLTGSRAGEVLQAQWEQFDLDRAVWTKPSHATKQHREEHIPLSKAAVELLRSMRPKPAAGILFPGKQKKEDKEKKRDAAKRTRVTLRNPWVAACKAAGLVEETTVKRGKRIAKPRFRPTVRIHDLRHSFASHLVSNGVPLYEVGKLLGHTQPTTTARYAHLQNETLRTATNVFGRIYTDAGTAKTGTR